MDLLTEKAFMRSSHSESVLEDADKLALFGCSDDWALSFLGGGVGTPLDFFSGAFSVASQILFDCVLPKRLINSTRSGVYDVVSRVRDRILET